MVSKQTGATHGSAAARDHGPVAPCGVPAGVRQSIAVAVRVAGRGGEPRATFTWGAQGPRGVGRAVPGHTFGSGGASRRSRRLRSPNGSREGAGYRFTPLVILPTHASRGAPHERWREARAPIRQRLERRYLEAEYERSRRDPSGVPPALADFFRGFDLAMSMGAGRPGPSEAASGGSSLRPAGELPMPEPIADSRTLRFQTAVNDLIEAYRSLGHMAARLDPFGRDRARPKALSLEHWGLAESDLDQRADGRLLGLSESEPLRAIVARLERMYCQSVGVEFAHIQDTDERAWLQARFEREDTHADLSRKEKAHLLELLIKSELFEQFIQKRYPGEKRFSLEGAESLIALLTHDRARGVARHRGVRAGDAHRGRLNVLNSIWARPRPRSSRV